MASIHPINEETTQDFEENVQTARNTSSDLGGQEQKKKIGRPRKNEDEKYKSVHIRLHPKVLAGLKAEAEKRGIRYQSLINELLSQHV